MPSPRSISAARTGAETDRARDVTLTREIGERVSGRRGETAQSDGGPPGSRPLKSLVVSLGLLLALPGAATAQRLELDARYWAADVVAEAKIEGGPLLGTAFDFKTDLGIDDEPLADLRLALFTGPHSTLRITYTRASYEADTIIGRAIEFNGVTYPAGARVVSELDLHYARLGWLWRLPVIPGKLRVGPILEAKAFVARATLEAPATAPPLQETERFAIVIPTAGLAFDLRPHPRVELFAEVSGLTLGDRGHVVDAEAGARISLVKFLAITGGYRFFDVRGEEDASFARLRLAGPFVGLTVTF